MTQSSPSARQYIVDLASRGRHHFTTTEAGKALGLSLSAVQAVLRRLAKKAEIAAPYRGFHVLVPPEYRRLGCLPPEQFVPQLMAHLDVTYYAALLTAAELHGAAHHRPQSFQVMVQSSRRPIHCGAVRVQFIGRRDLDRTPVIEKNTPRGPLRVASAAATALELVGYAGQCGGLDHVAAVLLDLGPAVAPDRLLAAAALCPIAWVQRLGYLLDLGDQRALADALVDHVAAHAQTTAPLLRSQSVAGAERAPRWRLAVNATVTTEQ